MQISTETQQLLTDLAEVGGFQAFPEDDAPYSAAAIEEARRGGLVRIAYPFGIPADYYTLTNAGRIAIGLPPKPSLYDRLLAWLDRHGLM